MRCPRCQQENPPLAKFCLECATPLALRCGGCGTQLPAAARFCFECAKPVSAPDSPSRLASPEVYTPKHLAERIINSKAALEGERKQVTILFADLKGSMELLADRDPEEARKLLDPVLELMIEAVHRYEGTVNQVMGDGIMALFGAPVAHEDHAARAGYAALRMQELMARYAEDARRRHGVHLQIRVGINSGEVVVRAIGGDLRMDYTAVGQTTHLAARMEQLANPGTILLTAATLELVEGFLAVKPLGPVPVKGLAEPVEVYEVTGAGPARTRLQAAARRGLTRFVGRDAELELMRGALQRADRGHGQVVGRRKNRPVRAAPGDCRTAGRRPPRQPLAPSGRRVPRRDRALSRSGVCLHPCPSARVTYGSLLQERRRELHAQIVGAIERLAGDRRGNEIERLAHHAVGGGLGEKAAGYCREAGLKALGRSALVEARAWLEQALEVLAGLTESPSTLVTACDIRLDLRPVLANLGDVRAALARTREAERLAERLNDDRRRGRVAALMTNIHALLGQQDEALITGTRALEIARRLGDLRLRILSTSYLEQVHYYRGDYERVVELATDNLAALPADWVYEYFGMGAPPSIWDRSWQVMSLAQLGRFAEAAAVEAEVIRLAEPTQHGSTISLAYFGATTFHLIARDWVKARASGERWVAAVRAGNVVLQLPWAIVTRAF